MGNRNEWAFFPKSNRNNPVLHTNTHCLNKPAQLTMTHFMFPIVAWLAGLEYFACILRSSCASHTLIESLSTMIHFFGVMTCRVQLNSCQQSPGPSTTPGSQTTELGWEFCFVFYSNYQNIHTKVSYFQHCVTMQQQIEQHWATFDWCHVWWKSYVLLNVSFLSSSQCQRRQV